MGYQHSWVKYGFAAPHKRFRALKWGQEKKVDLVYCSNVIEHVEDTKSFVEEVCSTSQRWVCFQGPYEEYHSNGDLITPNNPKSEHVWTVDKKFTRDFLNLSIFK